MERSPADVHADALAMVLEAGPTAPAHMRSRLRCWLAVLRWPAESAEDVVMAASEAVSNAVEHAFPQPAREGRVRVVADAFLDRDGCRRVALTVADNGQWRPEPEHAGYRRRGLFMMRALMESVQVGRSLDGTTVTMTSRPVHG